MARVTNRTVTTIVGTAERSSEPTVIMGNGHGEIQAASELARRMSAPLVVHLHSPPWSIARLGKTRRRAILSAAMYVAVSEALRSAWVEAGLPVERTRVVHNGVDLTTWSTVTASSRARSRTALGISPDTFVYLYAGRVTPQKGVGVLVDALDHPLLEDSTTVIVGFAPADSRSPFERSIAASLRSERLLAMQATPSILEAYHAADVVVVPSVSPDSFPLTILEAMAAGLPVVTTRSGGCVEGIPQDLLRFVVDPGDVRALRASLLAIRKAIEGGEPLGESARAHVVGRFSVDHMISEFEHCLHEVLDL